MHSDPSPAFDSAAPHCTQVRGKDEEVRTAALGALREVCRVMQPDITWHQTEASKKQTGALLKLLVEMLQDRRLVDVGYGGDVLVDGGYGWHVLRLRIGILTLNWHARVCVCSVPRIHITPSSPSGHWSRTRGEFLCTQTLLHARTSHWSFSEK